MTDDLRGKILDARDLVKQGWCQGEMVKLADGRYCHCLLGALHHVKDIGRFKPVHDAVASYLRRHYDHGDIVSWNDHPTRTQAEVIALLEAVAAEGGGR